MPRLYVLRHGETEWNAARRIQGQIDTSLNDKGRAQAWRNGLVLKDLIGAPDTVDFMSSPLKRATETMEIARAAMGLNRGGYRLDARLKELHYGDWQGLFTDKARLAHPEISAARRADPWTVAPPGAGGESFAALAERVLAWLNSVSRDSVVVTHGGVSRVLRVLLLGLPPAQIVTLEVPQDRILRIDGHSMTWH
jgi:probable phosphoglycerate mutase